jgi:hypothetical protein
MDTLSANKNFPSPMDSGKESYLQWDTRMLNGYDSIQGGEDSSVQDCLEGSGVHGLLWTSVRNVSNLLQPGSTFGPLNPDTYTPLSSHYELGSWGLLPVCVNINFKMPAEEAVPCALCDCPSCGFWGVPNGNIFINPNPSERWFVATDGLATRLVAKIPGDLWLQDDVRWGSASDSVHTRHTRLTGPDFVTVSRTGNQVFSAVTLRDGGLVSLLRGRGGRVTADPNGPDFSVPEVDVEPSSVVQPPPREGFALVVSKSEGLVFLAGGQDAAKRYRDLWSFSVDQGTWRSISIPDGSVGNVQAMTYRLRDRQLYLIDEVNQGPVFKWGRLLRVDPFTGAVKVLGWWPRIKQFDDFFLSVAEDGDLLVAASRKGKSPRHLVLALRQTGADFSVRWALNDKGALLGIPTLTDEGLTRPLSPSSSSSERFVPTSELPKKKKPLWGLKDCF